MVADLAPKPRFGRLLSGCEFELAGGIAIQFCHLYICRGIANHRPDGILSVRHILVRGGSYANVAFWNVQISFFCLKLPTAPELLSYICFAIGNIAKLNVKISNHYPFQR